MLRGVGSRRSLSLQCSPSMRLGLVRRGASLFGRTFFGDAPRSFWTAASCLVDEVWKLELHRFPHLCGAPRGATFGLHLQRDTRARSALPAARAILPPLLILQGIASALAGEAVRVQSFSGPAERCKLPSVCSMTGPAFFGRIPSSGGPPAFCARDTAANTRAKQKKRKNE